LPKHSAFTNQIRRWLSGPGQLDTRHGLFRGALKLLRKREREIGDAIEVLERYTARDRPA
jgi:hypothetical protein